MTTDPYQPDMPDERPDCPDELPPAIARVFRALRAGAELGSAWGSARGSEGVEPLVGASLAGGKYRLIAKIGSGGFGVVYEAAQCRVVLRQVAIKIAEGAAHDPRFADRMKDEQRALAALDDPAIVRVLDSGVTPAGFPGGAGRQYLVMDLVRGVPITEYCEGEKLDLTERLLLLAEATRAMAAGHRRGVRHRDIKPAHILIDEEGRVRLIDFGVAWMDEGDRLSRTMTGQTIGSPRYMSPEQRAGRESEIDNRVDVYALGMVLADLVLGERALELDPATLARVPVSELLGEAGTTRRVEAGSAGRQWLKAGHARRWRRACRAHVDWVLHKAITDSPEKRYKTADDLRAELVRAARGENVSARPTSTRLLLRAFVRRRPVLSTAAVVLTLVMAVGVPVLTVLSVSNARLARAAVAEAAAARFETFVARLGAAQGAVDVGSYEAAREHLASAPPEHRGWLWEHLSFRCSEQGRTLFALEPESGQVKATLKSLSLDSAGRFVAVARNRGRVFVLDAATGRVVAEHALLESELYAVAWSPKPGGPLAVGGWSNTLWLVDADAPEAAPRGIPTEHPIVRLCFSPDGSVLAAGSADSPEVFLYSMPTGELLTSLRLGDGHAYALAFDAQGERLFAGTDTGWIETWDIKTQERLAGARFGSSRIHSIERAPAGDRLAVCFYDGTLLLLAPDSEGTLRIEARALGTRGLLECAFSLDGSTLYTAGFDTTITAWSVPGLQQQQTWRQHKDHVYSLRVHPTDGSIYSCNLDGTVRILDPAGERPAIERWTRVYRNGAVEWGSLGRFVLLKGQDGYTIVNRITGGRTRLPPETAVVENHIRISQRGDLSWTNAETGDGWVLSAEGESIHIPHAIDPALHPTEVVVMKRPGAVVVRAIEDGVALVQHLPAGLAYYDLATGELRAIDTEQLAAIDRVAFDPLNNTPLVIRSGLDIFTADLAGRMRHLVRIPTATAHDQLQLTRNGRWLMVFSNKDSEAWLYDLRTRQLVHHLPARGRTLNNAAISADGRRAMFGRNEGDVDIIDTATNRLLASLPVSDNVHSVAFDADGSLWARTYSGTTHAWRLGQSKTPGEETPGLSGVEEFFEPTEAGGPDPLDDGD